MIKLDGRIQRVFGLFADVKRLGGALRGLSRQVEHPLLFEHAFHLADTVDLKGPFLCDRSTFSVNAFAFWFETFLSRL